MILSWRLGVHLLTHGSCCCCRRRRQRQKGRCGTGFSGGGGGASFQDAHFRHRRQSGLKNGTAEHFFVESVVERVDSPLGRDCALFDFGSLFHFLFREQGGLLLGCFDPTGQLVGCLLNQSSHTISVFRVLAVQKHGDLARLPLLPFRLREQSLQVVPLCRPMRQLGLFQILGGGEPGTIGSNELGIWAPFGARELDAKKIHRRLPLKIEFFLCQVTRFFRGHRDTKFLHDLVHARAVAFDLFLEFLGGFFALRGTGTAKEFRETKLAKLFDPAEDVCLGERLRRRGHLTWKVERGHVHDRSRHSLLV